MRALLVAALLVLAGCASGGPTATATTDARPSVVSPTPDPTPTVVVETRRVGGQLLAADRISREELRAQNYSWLNYSNMSSGQRAAFRTALNRSEAALESVPFGSDLATYAVAYDGGYYVLHVGLWDDYVTRTVRQS